MAFWNYQNIDYGAIEQERVAEDDHLFVLLTIASFIEITSDIYVGNLSSYFDDSPETVTWLDRVWEPEELQHGEALKKYIHTAWPDFDWEAAYEGFREEYGAICNLEVLQPTRAREMLARMIVETGTSTLYKAFLSYAEGIDEPVLAKIVSNISKDEVHHFARFEEGFEYYNREEKLSRTEIVKIMISRLGTASDEDIRIAYKHIRPGADFEELRRSMKQFGKAHYPQDMAVKMMLRPLRLNKAVESVTAVTLRQGLRVFGI